MSLLAAACRFMNDCSGAVLTSQLIQSTYDEWQRRRLSVLPGITGLWQILGRKDLPMHDNLHYDFYYLRNRSFLFDLSILLRTVLVVFSRRGAY